MSTTLSPLELPPRPRRGRQLPRFLRPFHHPAYRRLGAAVILGSFASGAWVVALVWEVIRIGGEPGELSTVVAANAVGLLLAALPGGVVADRVRQKLILLAVAGVEVVGMSLVALLSWTDATQLWQLTAVSFVTGVAMAFYYPAYSAWLPALIPDECLMAVNGFEGMVRPAVGQALGPAVAGSVVGAVSSTAAIGVAAGGGLAALLVLTAVPLTTVRRAQDAGGEARRGAGAAMRTALTDVREGFGYMMRTRWLLATLLFVSVVVLVLMGPMQVLLPFLIAEVGGGAEGHAMVLATFGLGGALGSLVMGQLRMPRRYLTFVNLMWGAGCMPFLIVGFADQVWLIALATFLLGASFSAPMVVWGTLLQRRVPPALLGRVASLDWFVTASLMPLSMGLAGPVADLVGMRTTFMIGAVVPVFAAVVAIVAAKLRVDELAHPV